MDENRNRSGLLIGAILVAVGILSLVGQVAGFWINGIAWPFIVMGVGVAFFVAMVLSGKSAGPLAIPGSIIFVVGSILFVQNAFGLWETWAYAWALIVAAVGAGLVVNGAWSGNPELRQRGWRVFTTGLTLFLVFGAMMEFVFSVTGVSGRFSILVWASVLAVVGLVQLIFRIVHLVHNPGEYDRHNDLFGPIFLMGIGALAILTSLGWITTGRLLSLINLWPLLLIVGGVRLLFGRRNAWVSAGLGLLFVAALLFVALAGDRLGIATGTPWMFIPGITFSDSGFVKEQINGSGSLSLETRTVSGFNQVRMEGIGELVITQGENEQLTIEAESNLLPHLTSQVRGQELVLGIEPGIRMIQHKTITYRLTVKDLKAISLPGAGNVTVKSLTANALDVRISGAGNFTVTGLAAKQLTVNLSGAGNVQASGKADSLDLELSGAGNFGGEDLASQTAQVNISGFGKAVVWVSENLESNISGFGSISYYGHPSVSQNNSGIGNVHSLGNK